MEVKKDPGVTKPQLEKILGKAIDSFTRYISELRKMGIIKCEGPKKPGNR